MKRIIRLLRSMRFAIGILLLLGIGSALGTLLPQNEMPDFYAEKFGETAGGVITRLGLSHVFSTYWFALLVVLLCVSLLFCVIFRAGKIHKSIRLHGFRKNRQLIGSWLLHGGILCTIFFFALGNATAYQSTVRNIPGTVSPVEDTQLQLAIDDFDIELREDGSVSSYTTAARVLDGSGEQAEGLIQVNHPITVDGYQFSQSATGYAVNTSIERDGEGIGSAMLFQGEYVTSDQDALVLTMLNLFPDYVQTADGPATQSLAMNNPYILYRLYYNGRDLGARIQPVHAPVSVGEYRFVFTEPAMFTALSVRKDPFAVWTGAGAALLLAGILLVFVAPDNTKEEADARDLHTN